MRMPKSISLVAALLLIAGAALSGTADAQPPDCTSLCVWTEAFQPFGGRSDETNHVAATRNDWRRTPRRFDVVGRAGERCRHWPDCICRATHAKCLVSLGARLGMACRLGVSTLGISAVGLGARLGGTRLGRALVLFPPVSLRPLVSRNPNIAGVGIVHVCIRVRHVSATSGSQRWLASANASNCLFIRDLIRQQERITLENCDAVISALNVNQVPEEEHCSASNVTLTRRPQRGGRNAALVLVSDHHLVGPLWPRVRDTAGAQEQQSRGRQRRISRDAIIP
jgi:hypothetical protein